MVFHKGLMAVVGLVTFGLPFDASGQSPPRDSQSLDQAYAIVDFQTPRSGREIGRSLQRHLQGQGLRVVFREYPIRPIPRTPGRFTLVDPTARSDFGLEGPTTRARAGWLNPVRTVVCNGASWRADVIQRLRPSIEQRYTLCLFHYRDGRVQGHHLDIYATTILQADPNATVDPLVGVETTEDFMQGAVQAVERLTRKQGVWVEHRKSNRDRPFTQGDDALSAETH